MDNNNTNNKKKLPIVVASPIDYIKVRDEIGFHIVGIYNENYFKMIEQTEGGDCSKY
ncbi:MAG: hypothetical protein IKF64_08215 [Eubacterium sp.]|nr:hypothetical protein [Eubacterium sp.]